MTTTDLNWDPFDTVIDSAPYEVWRRMRDELPVYTGTTSTTSGL